MDRWWNQLYYKTLIQLKPSEGTSTPAHIPTQQHYHQSVGDWYSLKRKPSRATAQRRENHASGHPPEEGKAALY